ncbi:MAG: DUF1489 domain-containing protein [Rhodobacteraceae bacterium]|nr:DUF1489 domain-containing protein [Paracoccaceae bacterium]
MADAYVNLVKLCVGAESVESLQRWQDERIAAGVWTRPEHVTRMRPKRAAEILNGGSLYWVIHGLILARQRIVGLEPRLGGDNITRCAIVMDRRIVRTAAVPRRPFQGWRYLPLNSSPPDLTSGTARDDALPEKVANELAWIGVI